MRASWNVSACARRRNNGPRPSAHAQLDSPPTATGVEAEFKPDCVLTLEGPAYVRFRSFHVLGCSTAWVTHATWSAVRSLGSPVEWGICIGRNLYKGMWFRAADAWIAQTETARQGMAKRLHLPIERIGLVLNTCGEHYLSQQDVRRFPEPGQPVRILCFSFPHRHKNLLIIPQIAQLLAERRPELNFRIVLTLPPDNPLSRRILADAERRGVTHLLENKGPVPLTNGPALYRDCDICLLPTLLETFSATYPEAMAMGLPIVTTDLGFAHDVCDDAALYFRPEDAHSAVDTIVGLLADRALWDRQVKRGKEVSPAFRRRNNVINSTFGCCIPSAATLRRRSGRRRRR